MILKGALKQLQIRRFFPKGGFFIILNGTDIALKIDDRQEINPTTVYLDVDQNSFDDANEAGLLFYMALHERASEAVASVQGLLLLHQGAGTFVRLGVCETYFYYHEDLIRSFRAHHENEASLPCLSFHPDDHAHTIKIV